MQVYVYFIQQGKGSIKIGVSANPEGRLKELQTGTSKILSLLLKVPMPSRMAAMTVEKDLHAKYAQFRGSGEWFHRRILKELKVRGTRLIGGSYVHPMPLQSDGSRKQIETIPKSKEFELSDEKSCRRRHEKNTLYSPKFGKVARTDQLFW